jgi:hypothetical protein
LIGSIYIFAIKEMPLNTKYLYPFVLINTLFLGNWISGRDKYKKIQQEEMNKMKAKDI